MLPAYIENYDNCPVCIHLNSVSHGAALPQHDFYGLMESARFIP